MPITATDLIGLKCRFDYEGKRLSGIITKAAPAKPWGPSGIPDFTVTVRGHSGAVLTVSMVETYMDLPDR